MVAIELRKLEVKFNKWYVDMCILDISKTYLYEFHHEYVASLFREKCKIIYTGSLIYHIECDVCTTSWNVISIDTSDYLSDNAYGIPLENKKIPDFMKDENNGAIIIHRA